jgi:hypothetical protein
MRSVSVFVLLMRLGLGNAKQQILRPHWFTVHLEHIPEKFLMYVSAGIYIILKNEMRAAVEIQYLAPS